MKFEIDINDIISYQNAYNTSFLTGIIPLPANNAFAICANLGITYKFAVSDRSQLFQLLKQLIPKVEQAPNEKYLESVSRAWRGVEVNDKKASKQRMFVIILDWKTVLPANQLYMNPPDTLG